MSSSNKADSRVGHEQLVRASALGVPQTESRAFLGLFAIAFVTLTLVSMAFVAWANVWGNYADEGYFSVYNDRRGKVEALLQTRPEALPEAWIIGASTTYPLSPSIVQALTGLETYSLANYWARMEENYAWLRFVLEDLEQSPKMIVLGLSTWSFRPDNRGPVPYPTIRRRLINSPRKLPRHSDHSEVEFWQSRVSGGSDEAVTIYGAADLRDSAGG